MKKVLILLGAALCMLGAHPVAHAQGKKAALAKKHFQKAELLYQQGEFKKALAQYKKAMTYKRHPALIFNIAQCYRQLGNNKMALFFYKLFLSELPNASNIKEVLLRIKEMEKKLAAAAKTERAKGKVSVITVPAGAEVRVDKMSGAVDGITPVLIALTPGEHLLVIRKKGYRDIQKTVAVASGKIAMVRLNLKRGVGTPPDTRPGPRVTPTRPVEPRPVEPRVTPRPVTGDGPTVTARMEKPVYKRWWFWTGLGVAAALGIAGTATGVLAMQKHKDWEDEGADEDRKSGKLQAALTDVFLFTGLAAAAAVTVAAIVVEVRRKKKKKEAASITPSCGPGGCGVFVRGNF